MNIAILLLCSLPPLAIMAVAVIRGLQTRSSTVLSMVALSALVVLASAILPIVGDEEPIPSVRFATPNGNGATSVVEDADTVRLARRSEPQALYR
jgi:hypothetical protein